MLASGVPVWQRHTVEKY